MGKTRPEITQQKAAWEKEWSSIATPKMIEALALLAALPDPQFTLVLERCLDRLRVIDRRAIRLPARRHVTGDLYPVHPAGGLQ